MIYTTGSDDGFRISMTHIQHQRVFANQTAGCASGSEVAYPKYDKTLFYLGIQWLSAQNMYIWVRKNGL